jgi:hypothetical protein
VGRYRWIVAISGILAIFLIAAGWLLRRSREGMRAGSWKGNNVLFVTIDTLRADRLPAYGGKNLETPAIDALAARGVLFERCVTATPLTLPSHTTIFSGTLPVHHGVRDNGAFTVPAELPLLAELFHAREYSTAAFVSAFVLDSRWKLNRGFDVYFDQFDTRQQNLLSIGDIERPAGDTVDAALDWLKRRDPAKPFFLWIHLFDPHAPYSPPPPFSEEYKDRPYLGEIAYVDSELGRLLRSIESDGLGDRTAIVLAGDHGESLGEHGENGHGFFLYEPSLHVPLMLVPPQRGRAARRRELVSLVDVMQRWSIWPAWRFLPGCRVGASSRSSPAGGGSKRSRSTPRPTTRGSTSVGASSPRSGTAATSSSSLPIPSSTTSRRIRESRRISSRATAIAISR